MVGKYVSERFKEKHNKDWKGKQSGKDIITKLIEELRAEARWEKAVQHLKESDNYTQSPKDIGNIFKEVVKDIDEEESEYIKDKLYTYYVKSIKAGVTVGIPEWYKNKLLENLKEKE
jgi:hypothetical protein